jgi:DNA-binding beta-propeller fold protein YncE
MALVTRNNDSLISILAIDNGKVTYTKRDITSGFKPYGVEITPDGAVALAANIGAGQSGSTDTISVIDLKATPPRAVDQVAAGTTLEGLTIAPDGRHAALTVMNGTNTAKASGFYNDFGLLKVFSLKGTALAPVATAKLGHWCQGVAWTPDARTVIVECMIEKELELFDFDGKALKPAGTVKVSVSPAGIRTAK